MKASKGRTDINQDPVHKEQQKLFLFLGHVTSLHSQLDNSTAHRNSYLTKPLDLTKYNAVSSQLCIELKNLETKIREQMSNLKSIVNVGGGGGEERTN